MEKPWGGKMGEGARKWAEQVSRRWGWIWDLGLGVLYPEECRVCGGRVEEWAGGVACRACWQRMDERRARLRCCQRCGGWLTKEDTRTCPNCPLEGEGGLVAARSAGPHEGALRESVLWLKRHPRMARRVRESLGTAWQLLPGREGVEVLIPVPLHPTREQERGFNQAEVMARWLGQETGLPVETTSLIRRRPTERHRLGMGRRERSRSLEGAFVVRAPRLVEGRSLLLVDDVMTTGTTALAIGETLRQAGATAVRLVTLTRASSDPAR
jgi:ComF family protein